MDGAVAVRTGLVLGVTILLGGSVLLFAVVALLAYLPHRLRTPTRARRRAVQAQWREQAAVLTERAELARARAARSARELAAAEPASAAAWRELEAAQAAYDEAVQRYQRLRDGGGPTVDPPGRQLLTHAAFAAYRRGDLTRDELWKLLELGSGWDAERREQERRVRERRAALREAHLRYRAAAARERRIREELRLADVEARACTEEAAEAAGIAAGMARWSG